ncbi:MAG TPA: host attachment protein [Rhizomicrobium sp.]|jgi:protein required for attachment to host cells|nr:host attachment protein [Rhizomicrobium sp.]
MSADHTLVAVFDASRARFFEYDRKHGRLDLVLEDIASGLARFRRDIESDRPGRGFSSSGQHHAYESQHDPRKQEKHNFVRAIAGAIGAALDRNMFNALVVVAPERSVGEFRSVASDRVKSTIWREVPKEYANLTDSELEKVLVPILQAPPE